MEYNDRSGCAGETRQVMTRPLSTNGGFVGLQVPAGILLVLCAVPGACQAAPPPDSAWKMTFNDEFQRRDLSLEKWTAKDRSSARSSGRSQPEVLRDNIRIKDGVCKLLTTKGGHDGKRWMTANFFTKAFKQRYGYFEARIKISGTAGLTNVFALTSRDSATSRTRFYIDVVNAHYPNEYLTRAGIPRGPQGYPVQSRTAAVDLSKDYHLYALHWTDSELIWYFDGREIRRLSHTLLRHPARVQLVTWVGGFGGKVTDALDGAALEVDYVRVYKKLQRPPDWSKWHDGIQ